MKLRDLFIKRTPYELLSALNSLEFTYPSFLARKINCSFFHTADLLRKFEDAGLVRVEKNGVAITEKGKRVFEVLRNIEEIENEENASLRFIKRTIMRIRSEESEEKRKMLLGFLKRELMGIDEEMRREIERELGSEGFRIIFQNR
ncbi:MAG: hypothetical protein PWR13_55 [Archaeoglobi archaeon]|nr:hypothetical protein [Candidatus Mnemosynella bozhongmuii]MDI3502706.1 hypothetical protein [Archaeoglobi archaeon]MDK2781027.1 hypothetical protein [Archaeoglobi archaeon]